MTVPEPRAGATVHTDDVGINRSSKPESRVQRARAKVQSPQRKPSSDPSPSTPAPPPVPGRRNPKWIALGIVALCLGALLSFVIYSRVADEIAVVSVVNTVHRGSTVTAADLTTVSVKAGAGVQTVPASS